MKDLPPRCESCLRVLVLKSELRKFGIWPYEFWYEGSLLEERQFGSLPAFWGFLKSKGTFLGVPIKGTIVYLGLYWGPPILGNYHITRTRVIDFESLANVMTKGHGQQRPGALTPEITAKLG